MKKKGGERKKAAGVSAKADGSAGTPKKKTTTSAKQKKNNPPDLTDIKETPINQRKAPLRVLCHHWSPTHGEILFAQLGMRFRSHPLMCIFRQLTVMTLFGQPSLIFLLLTIFSLSITVSPKIPTCILCCGSSMCGITSQYP